jgi:tetratricopeptide (TPR) repeat protein
LRCNDLLVKYFLKLLNSVKNEKYNNYSHLAKIVKEKFMIGKLDNAIEIIEQFLENFVGEIVHKHHCFLLKESLRIEYGSVLAAFNNLQKEYENIFKLTFNEKNKLILEIEFLLTMTNAKRLPGDLELARLFLGKIQNLINEAKFTHYSSKNTNIEILEIITEYYSGQIDFRNNQIEKGQEVIFNAYNKSGNFKKIFPDLFFYGLEALGYISIETGRFIEGFSNLNLFLDTNNEIDPITKSEVFAEIASIYFLQGRFDEALEYLQKAIVLISNIPRPHSALYLGHIGIIYYTKNEYSKSINYLKEGIEKLKKFYDQDLLSSQITDLVIIYAELEKFDEIISLMKLFPQEPYRITTVEFYKLLIEGIVAYHKNNLGYAQEFFTRILQKNPASIRFKFKIKCFEYLTKIEFKNWRINTTEKTMERVKEILSQWRILSENNNLIPSLCTNLLINAKIEFSQFNLNKAESLLLEIISQATTSGLPLHKNLAEKELESLYNQREQIISETELKKEKFTNDQVQEVASYIMDLSKLFDLSLR